MKFNSFIKLIPFLSTILFIVILNIGNQKQDTKLRILIWNTPSLSIGSYIALSTGAGFILSYFITNNLAALNHLKLTKSIKYKVNTDITDNDEYIKTNIKPLHENTLIERDINDPSPTVKARFRVIGKTESIDYDYINKNEDIQNYDENEFEDKYFDEEEISEYNIQENSVKVDWNDNSFLNW